MAAPALTSAPLQRPRMLVVGTSFASVAAAMAIIGMIGVYLTQRSQIVTAGGTWLPDGVDLPLTQPNVMLFGLIMCRSPCSGR